MTNLYTGTINTNGEYKTLSNETGLTFENNKKYSIQIQGGGYIGNVYLREGTTGKGFLIKDENPITYTKGNSDLYIYTSDSVLINIAG